MSEKEKNSPILDKRSSRRTFIKNSGLTVGGVVLGGALGSLLVNKDKTATPEAPAHTETGAAANPNVALMFFTPDEYRMTQTAVERIYPADDNGPGAKDLNAAIYIDHQLAGQYGLNSKDYRLGNFYAPEPTQGAQTKILNKDLFLLGLKELNNYSKQNFEANFVELEAADQDTALAAFSEGKAQFAGTSSSEFFNLLRKLTIEGVYADPLYGGNKDMQGWAMRKYPGSRMSYVKEIQSETFVKLDPQGLNSHMGH
ncbi:gluconate 2-dehydrogenase subunit 3 family protein [Psychrobacillus lasiicapitis]|uniref:Gluconate 2-dehydrogenase subunit 3 family protein n=1 Tax=Psychrobacillus lasiicapitis TaxID=1636719 RepID=A0A544STV4_9BACI|nr:gluconate 2-dehydrogenase subunit 3 family protein [Psychrobacillus lasiicapitis]TQR08652.1 gluconate 2-dehydrogenase subunit 3 family protein [Psychrobacillus lasiicapitis]GGA45271.1 oxidoreductase [Psychrobacillus lasiicapitis]